MGKARHYSISSLALLAAAASLLPLLAPHASYAAKSSKPPQMEGALPIKEQQAIKEQLAAKQAEKAAIEKQSKLLSSQVNDLSKKLVSTTSAVRKTEENLDESEEKLKNLTSRRDALAASLQKDEQSLGSLVTAARKYNSLSTPLLMMREKPIDAARSALIMKGMMPVLQAQSQDMQQQLSELAATEDRIGDERAKHAKDLKDYNSKQDKLQDLLKQRTASYQETEAARKKQEAEVTALAAQAKSLDDLMEKMKRAEDQRRAADEKRRKAAIASGKADNKGRRYAGKEPLPLDDDMAASNYKLPARFLPPVSGAIRSGFGERDSLGATSRGITFNTRPGASVVTPLPGKVIFAGPFQKYKQILIVQHKGGYHSLIAGLGHIDTVVGASLTAGEPVGTAERSASNSLIYYEFRQNGKPVNPQSISLAQR